jgi:leucyl aminopeptidase
MACLAPVRDELLRGDIRSLYIGWLSAVTREMIDDDETEPLPMQGLGNLTVAQQALAEFLEVDEDILAGAGMGSPARQDEGHSQQEMDEWIDGLARDEVTVLLKQLLVGRGQQAERTLKNQFAAWKRGLQSDKSEAPRRMVGELRKHAEAAKRLRHKQEKRDQEQRELKRRKERETYLAALSKDFPKVWKVIQQTVERGSGLAYDEACRALADLAEAYKVHGTPELFEKELRKFMTNHMRRKTLIQRLAKAGILNEK